MSETFFTSDMHYGHVGILSHAKRPFESVEEMNEELIKRYNAKVSKKDNVYILGDVAFQDPRPLVDRLNGRKHLVYGNHDERWMSKLHACPFQWIKLGYELKMGEQKIWLAHFPHVSWGASHYGSLHFFGHSHGSYPGTKSSLDVGVDCWDLSPVSYEEILVRLLERPFAK